MGGASGYIISCPATAFQIYSKERAAHSIARNAVLVPISQGTEVTIVTEPGCHPVSDTWRPYSCGQTKQKKGLNNVGQVNPEDCYLSRKDSGLQGRDIQVVKPYKCGPRGPAGHITNV